MAVRPSRRLALGQAHPASLKVPRIVSLSPPKRQNAPNAEQGEALERLCKEQGAFKIGIVFARPVAKERDLEVAIRNGKLDAAIID